MSAKSDQHLFRGGGKCLRISQLGHGRAAMRGNDGEE